MLLLILYTHFVFMQFFKIYLCHRVRVYLCNTQWSLSMAKKQKILGCGYFMGVKQQTQRPSVIRYRRVKITRYLCKLNMSFLHTREALVYAKVSEH